MGLGGVGSRFRSFLFASLTLEPVTELPRLLDLLRLFLSFFSFSLLFFSFFFLLRLDELLVEELPFFFSSVSSFLGVTFNSLLGLPAFSLSSGATSFFGSAFSFAASPWLDDRSRRAPWGG